jgi:5'-deoxynucleotidase YfbR-like HD superfamily hydrolase
MNLWDACTGKVSRMSYVNRFSSFPVSRRENVAEHSWWVAFISLLIGYSVQEDPHMPEVNMEKLLTRAVTHDLNETLSGDIIRSYKYSTEELLDAIRNADAVNMARLGAEFGEANIPVTAAWRDAKADDVEGEIIAFADMASVVFYLREEHKMGNKFRAMELVNELHQKWFHRFSDHLFLAKFYAQIFPMASWADPFREEPFSLFPIMRDHREGPVAAASFGRADRDPLT